MNVFYLFIVFKLRNIKSTYKIGTHAYSQQTNTINPLTDDTPSPLLFHNQTICVPQSHAMTCAILA